MFSRTTRSLAGLLASLVLLAACGGGGVDTGGDPALGLLRIESTSPEDGASDIGYQTVVAVVFEEGLDPTSVDQDALTLASAFGPIPGTVSYAEPQRRLLFTPDDPLPVGAMLYATLRAGLRDTAGNETPGDYAFSFETRARAFEAPRVREALSAQMRIVDFKLSSRGEGAYVRLEVGATTKILRAHYFDAETGFGSVFTVRSSPDIADHDHVMAVNHLGDMVVAWREFDGAQHDVYLRRYRNGTWDAIEPIEEDAEEDANQVRVALSIAGDIMIGWYQENLTSGERRFAGRSDTPTTDWTDIRTLDASSGGVYRYSMQLGFNIARQGFVAWEEDDPLVRTVWVRRWDLASGFRAADWITQGLGSYTRRKVVMDNTGRIIVLCGHGNGGTGDLIALVYLPGLGWQTPLTIEPRVGENPRAQLVLDEDRNAMFLWGQDGDTMHARRLSRDGILSDTATLDTQLDDITPNRRLIATGESRFMAFWRVDVVDGVETRGAEFDGSVWSVRRPIGRIAEGRDHFNVVPQASGGAIVLWTVEDNDPEEGYYRFEAYRVRRGMDPVADPVLEYDANAAVGAVQFEVDDQGRGAVVFVAENSSEIDDLWTIDLR